MSQDLETIVNQSYNTSPKYTEKMAGLPEDYQEIKTLGDLISINYKIVGVKEQLRRNLISLINSESPRYPGIIGFEDDVIPSLDRAILSGHDVFLIGQIGQAKTKIVETIAKYLLSPIPVIKNSITNDCPMDLPSSNLIALLQDEEQINSNPRFFISPESADQIKDDKLDTPIEWKSGKDRFKYVLATPDISVKDLVGYIDAIKIAKKGTELYKIESYTPGQLMQAKHGLFCIDELPVLDPRKQVALLSVLQEGRFTTGSFPIFFEPKTVFFATANPVDYTHSGKVIEPLYDRLKSHIHTHYPKSIEDEMMIILQEAKLPKSIIISVIPKTLSKIVHNLRNHPSVNQDRGVSVRLGIHALELLVGEAERVRGIKNKTLPVPRITDMLCLSQVAKFELSEMEDSVENRENFFKNMVEQSIGEICLEFLEHVDSTSLDSIKKEFEGKNFQVSQNIIWKNGMMSYGRQLEDFQNLKNLIDSNIEKAKSQQTEFEQNTKDYHLQFDSMTIPDDNMDELRSVMTEIILEALCWTDPKTLHKKESGYIAAQI